MQQPQITILTVGSRGDVQPYCALALGLKQAGFQVRIATNRNFAAFVTDLEIDFAPIAGNYKDLLNSPKGQNLLAGRSNRLVSDALLLEQLQDAVQACQGTDLLIFSVLALWGYHIAESLDVPCFLASAVPVSPTRLFPVLKFDKTTQNPLLGRLNYASYLLLEFLSERQSQPFINQFRQESLNLPALPWLGARYRPSPPANLHPLSMLYSFSPVLMPRPGDWPTHLHITGTWFLDQAQDYCPPQTLLDFLEAGAPPVCIGFGSMPVDAEKLTQTVLQALVQSGQRGIVLSGWADLSRQMLPASQAEQILVLDAVPHDWLFPRVAAVVHHCGAGTTAAVCRAGIPSVGVPFFADQPAWSQRLADLGVGTAPIPYRELSVERLTGAIQQAVSDPHLRHRAAELGQRLQAEDGVGQAVKLIQHRLSGRQYD
jgi:sterol 3beta-glucosyltransferase